MFDRILSPFRFIAWGLWTASCISFSFIAVALLFNRKATVWLAKHLWAPGALFFPGVKLTVENENNIDYSTPYVFVSNHQSYVDIPCIVKAIDTHLYFVAKKELKRLPFLGWYIAVSGMIFIDRSNKRKSIESVINAGKMIKNGKSILAFPEGTRSKNGNVLPFKKGTFLLALQSGVPIVPITIKGTDKIFPATKLQLIPGKVVLSIGEPIATDNYNRDNIDELIQKVQEQISAEKQRLDKVYHF